jgi:hypothetical protein
MGRMTWFKMFVNFDDPERWTSKADNEELGAWVRLLRLASISPVKGKIEIADGIPYTPEQLKKVIKSEKDYLKKWETQGAIKQENGVIIIEKWGSYQSEYERQKPYRQELQEKVTSESYCKSDPVEERRKKKEVRSKKKEEKKKDNTSATVKNPVGVWCEKFKAKFGEQYIITPKDAGHLNRVYKLIPEQFESKIDAFFEVDNWAHEYNVSIFQATLNKTKSKDKPLKSFGGERYGKDY